MEATMTIIQEKDRQVLAQRLSVLPNTVKLVVFTTSQQPETSELISQLMQELVSVSGGKLTLEQHSLEAEPTVAQEYGVTHAPAIVVRTEDERLRHPLSGRACGLRVRFADWGD
jgi:thioredoxin-like negative regulator of GroEL